MLRKIMKKCKKNYTNIILFLTFMLLWKYYIQAQRMEAIVVERMKFMIQHIYIIIAQMKIMLRNHAKNIFADKKKESNCSKNNFLHWSKYVVFL